MKLAIRTFSAIFIVLTGTQAFCGSDEQSKNLESVLDKLERRLLDRESAPLTYAEKKSVEASDTTTGKGQAKTPTIEVKTNKEIEGQTPNAKSLSEIQRKIAEYDAQLENLESETRRLHNDVVESSAIDNTITFDVKLKDPTQSTLRTLTARLDGSLVFNQTDSAGVWIPGKVVTIYHGPAQPGEHNLELTASLMSTNADGLPVQNWQQKLVKKAFTIQLPPGKQRRSWTIEFDGAEKEGSKNAALLIESANGVPAEEGLKR